MSFKIALASPEFVAAHWDDIVQCLRPAIAVAGGRWTESMVFDRLAQRKMGCVVVVSEGKVIAALTTMVLQYEEFKSMEIEFLGGRDGLQWGRNMLEVVEGLARHAKCARIEFRGRKEWGSVLRRDGYEAVSTLYEKVIEPCEASGTTDRVSLSHSPDAAPLP